MKTDKLMKITVLNHSINRNGLKETFNIILKGKIETWCMKFVDWTARIEINKENLTLCKPFKIITFIVVVSPKELESALTNESRLHKFLISFLEKVSIDEILPLKINGLFK
jgi:hypothetical protein